MVHKHGSDTGRVSPVARPGSFWRELWDEIILPAITGFAVVLFICWLLIYLHTEQL